MNVKITPSISGYNVQKQREIIVFCKNVVTMGRVCYNRVTPSSFLSDFNSSKTVRAKSFDAPGRLFLLGFFFQKEGGGPVQIQTFQGTFWLCLCLDIFQEGGGGT